MTGVQTCALPISAAGAEETKGAPAAAAAAAAAGAGSSEEEVWSRYISALAAGHVDNQEDDALDFDERLVFGAAVMARARMQTAAATTTTSGTDAVGDCGASGASNEESGEGAK